MFYTALMFIHTIIPCRNGFNEPQVFSRKDFSSLYAGPAGGGSGKCCGTSLTVSVMGRVLDKGGGSESICKEIRTHSACCMFLCATDLFV